MTPKQQAIKKAYGQHYDTFKHIIDPDGWVSWDRGAPCPNMEETDTHESGLYWRPKSLRGIENNRGWISVKDRLPDMKQQCWIWTRARGAVIYWNSFTESFEDENGATSLNVKYVTHWQPVVKPEPPLF